MVVRIWAWLMTNVFAYRRVRVYLRGGRVINLRRGQSETVESVTDDWKSWLAPANKVVRLSENGRIVTIKCDDIQGVDIR